MSTVNLLGSIVFASEVPDTTLRQLAVAAEGAGIPRDLLPEIKPKNAFIRAIRALNRSDFNSKKHLLHKFTDDAVKVAFQFSDVYLQSAGVQYEKNAVVEFDKKSHRIRCDQASILQHAEQFYVNAQSEVKSSDIYALIQRYVEKEDTKRIPLRDGVYFVPAIKQHVVDNLKKLFVCLNVSFFVVPINSTDAQNRVEILKATIQDVEKTVTAIALEIAELKASGNLTDRVARTRLKELHKQLRQYTELSTSLNESTANLVGAAGKAGNALLKSAASVDELIASVESGEHVPGFIYDLLEASTETALPPRELVVVPEVELDLVVPVAAPVQDEVVVVQ
jgi:hypothetical protein